MNKIISFVRNKENLPDILAVLFCVLFAISGSVVSVIRFWQYEVFYYDFGIFDGAIWKVAHFQPPIIEHFVHRGMWIFADHFNPTIFVLSPLYWVTNRSEIILIAQALIFGVCGFLIYYLGKVIAKNKWWSLSVLTCFFLFTGLQNAVITDFHEVSLTVLFFLLTFLSFLKKKNIPFFVFLLLMLGTKESNYILGAGFGLTIILLDRKQLKLAISTIIFSLIYGFLATKFIIPFFSGGSYQYGVYVSPNPLDYVNSLVNNSTKLSTIYYSFASFGFLPFLSPTFYLLIIEDFLARFYPPYLTLSWGLGFHYSAVNGAIMSIAAIYSYKNLEKIFKNKKIIYVICIILVLNSIFLYRFVLRGPFALSYNKAFYTHTKDFEFLNDLIAKVPPNVSVATQNNLAAHLVHQQILLLQDKCKTCQDYPYVSLKPQYIVIDAREGQNLNDFYGLSDYKKFLKSVLKDKNYKIVYHTADQYIFKGI